MNKITVRFRVGVGTVVCQQRDVDLRIRV